MIAKPSLVVLFALVAISACKEEDGFESNNWKADAGCSDGSDLRGRMINDLEEAHLSLGVVEQDVIALLGEPEERVGATFIYCLRRGLSDYATFHIAFDAENRVKSFKYNPG